MVNGKEITIGAIIALFIGVIVVLAVLPEIGTQTAEMTTKNNVVNESIDISTARNASGGINITVSNFTIANVPTGWKISKCPITGTLWGNVTTDKTSGTDYTFYPVSGILQVLVSSTMDADHINSTFIDYAYCQDGYITSGSGRSMAGLIVLLSALALVAFAIFFALKGWLE